MRRLRLSPAAYRRVTFLALLALGFIIVTGGAVRITQSGLGCPDWPTCAKGRVVPEWEYHGMVEFTNRVITGLVSLAVIVAVLGSLVRQPRRRDLTRLSLGLVAGVVGQIVLGGVTVLLDLHPALVASHLLLSLVILAVAVVLHERAGEPTERRQPVVPSDLVAMGRLVTAGAALVVVLGTVVTGSGPHAGDERAVRFPFALHDVARAHGVSVLVFLALTLLTLWRLARAGAPRALLARGELLAAVLVAQAGVGYAQYLTGVPALLVGIHIAGAAAVWAATVWFLLGFSVAEPFPPAAEGRTLEV